MEDYNLKQLKIFLDGGEDDNSSDISEMEVDTAPKAPKEVKKTEDSGNQTLMLLAGGAIVAALAFGT